MDPETSPQEAQKVKILVVEDSPATRCFVRASLQSATPALGSLEVVEASGGFEALRLLPHGPYALVITDINMPDLNGLELLSFIRSNGRHAATPVLLISTQAPNLQHRRDRVSGANEFLAKPFTVAQLTSAVATLLGTPVQAPQL